ncbi:MAG: cobalamin biosynthesis protein [Nitrospira sp.]
MTGIDLALAAVLDVAVGDPRWFPHPVRGMGAVIGWIDHRIRTICRSEQTLQIAGVCLALGLPAAVYGAAAWVIAEAVASAPNPGAGRRHRPGLYHVGRARPL